MDEKGGIIIPERIRNPLHLKPGQKFQIKVENGQIFLLKSTSKEEFLKEVEIFHLKLKESIINSISFDKLM